MAAAELGPLMGVCDCVKGPSPVADERSSGTPISKAEQANKLCPAFCEHARGRIGQFDGSTGTEQKQLLFIGCRQAPNHVESVQPSISHRGRCVLASAIGWGRMGIVDANVVLYMLGISFSIKELLTTSMLFTTICRISSCCC